MVAVKVLVEVVRRSKGASCAFRWWRKSCSLLLGSEKTTHGLQNELKKTKDLLAQRIEDISASWGCELFLASFNTRVPLSGVCGARGSHALLVSCEADTVPVQDVEADRRKMIVLGEKFCSDATAIRTNVASNSAQFFRDGMVRTGSKLALDELTLVLFIVRVPGQTILTHGYSRVVMKCLLNARCNIRLLVTEGGPSKPGLRTAKELENSRNTLVVLIPDVAVGARMPTVDMVLVGAAAVVESGGVVNRVRLFFCKVQRNLSDAKHH